MGVAVVCLYVDALIYAPPIAILRVAFSAEEVFSLYSFVSRRNRNRYPRIPDKRSHPDDPPNQCLNLPPMPPPLSLFVLLSLRVVPEASARARILVRSSTSAGRGGRDDLKFSHTPTPAAEDVPEGPGAEERPREAPGGNSWAPALPPDGRSNLGDEPPGGRAALDRRRVQGLEPPPNLELSPGDSEDGV